MDKKTLIDLSEAAKPVGVSMLSIYSNQIPERIEAAITAIGKLKERNDFTARGLQLDLNEDKILLYETGADGQMMSLIDEEPVILDNLKTNFKKEKRR